MACTVALAQRATDPDVHRLSPQDATFLQEMQRTDRTAIAAGKLALGKARVEAVKKYAQLVVDTHSKLLEDGKKVAKFERSQVPPEDDRANAAVLRSLQATPDDRFDRAYLAWVLEVQGRALAAARRASSEASDPNVRSLAANAAVTSGASWRSRANSRNPATSDRNGLRQARASTVIRRAPPRARDYAPAWIEVTGAAKKAAPRATDASLLPDMSGGSDLPPTSAVAAS